MAVDKHFHCVRIVYVLISQRTTRRPHTTTRLNSVDGSHDSALGNKRFVALEIDNDFRRGEPGQSGYLRDAVGSAAVFSREHGFNVDALQRVTDALVISRHHHVVETPQVQRTLGY